MLHFWCRHQTFHRCRYQQLSLIAIGWLEAVTAKQSTVLTRLYIILDNIQHFGWHHICVAHRETKGYGMPRGFCVSLSLCLYSVHISAVFQKVKTFTRVNGGGGDAMYSAVYAGPRCLSVRPSSICVCLSVTLIGVRKDPDIFPWDSFSRTIFPE